MTRNKKKERKKTGYLIVFEGISGAGKSETIKKMQLLLDSFLLDSVILEWNSNTFIQFLLRVLHRIHLLTPRIYSFFQVINFIIDYRFKYKHYLKKNYIILADRYIYTAIIHDATSGIYGNLSRFFAAIVPFPDLVIFINTPPLLCCQRIKNRDKSSSHSNRRVVKNNSKHMVDEEIIHQLSCLQKAYMNLFKSPVYKKLRVIKCPGEFPEISRCVMDFLDLDTGKNYNEKTVLKSLQR